MNIAYLGIDLAKSVFQLHGVDRRNHAVLRARVHRAQLIESISKIEPCVIGVEACTGAFYWQRRFPELGHTVKIVSPQYVRPFVRRQKNDGNDAEAICTAIQQPDMRFVPTRSLEQQDIQALHRARQRLVNHRTAVAFVLAKSIAGFSNADEGHLFVGVKEDKDSDTIEIIEIDAELNKLKDSTIDGYRRMIVDDVVMRFLPKAFLHHINRHLRIDFPIINGVTVCHLHVLPSAKPIFAKSNRDQLFVRIEASTREVTGEDVVDYCSTRFQNQGEA